MPRDATMTVKDRPDGADERPRMPPADGPADALAPLAALLDAAEARAERLPAPPTGEAPAEALARRLHATLGRAAALEASNAALLAQVALRDRQAAEVREQRDLYETLLAALGEVGKGLAVVDVATQRYLFVNDALATIFGCGREELLGRSPLSFIAPEALPMIEAQRQARLAGEPAPDAFELPCVRADGARITVETGLKTLRQGDRVVAVAVVRDVTARKQAEADLAARTRQLEVANAALLKQDEHKSAFLAIMSHELRTPLNAIIGYTELTLDHGVDRLARRHQRSLESVLESARHLLSLINDLLDLSKVNAGRMELDRGLLATRGVVDKVVAMVQAQADAKGLELRAEIEPRAEVAYGDARRVEQALLNLASNAVKFTPAGGRVAIVATPHPEGVQFTVADTGPGIAPEDQPHLFKEFVQLHSPTTRTHGGTGLGLALTRRLAELHGGRVWVESEPGKGAAFHLLLPGAHPRAPAREVLVVDDDPVFRGAAAGWAREAGFEAVEVGSAEAALAYLAGARPSAVVLDLNLPGAQGLELAARVRERPALKEVPLVFCSAVRLPEVEAMARDRFRGAWVPKGERAREGVLAELARAGGARA